jgi:hypothetical protein
MDDAVASDRTAPQLGHKVLTGGQMYYPKWSASAVLVTLLVSSACDSSDLSTDVTPTPGGVAQSSGATGPYRIWTPDDEFARIARSEIPGFAGYFLQEDGTPVVLLVDPAQRDVAARYLAAHSPVRGARQQAGLGRPPIIRQVAYDFAQLKGWYDQLNELFVRNDVFMLDVDEAANRVFVGVRDNVAIAAVRAVAARLGVPAAALHVETQPAPERRLTLRERPPALQGGYQIDRISGDGDECTLGFNAVYNGQSSFISASHCSRDMYALDYTSMSQPWVGPGAEIGSEIMDRELFYCGPYVVVPCRHSDAAIWSHNGSVAVDLGVLAETQWATGKSSTIEVIRTNDVVDKVTSSEFIAVGSILDKTGRTTGSTYGEVTQSCTRINELQCQYVSRIYSEGGDSGSPVYVWLELGRVSLQGVLWGGPAGDHTTTYSSPLWGIESDFETTLTVCKPGLGC